jgi:hypothetical protein
VEVTDNEKYSSILWYGIIYSCKGFTEQAQKESFRKFGGIFTATINIELLCPEIFVNFNHFQLRHTFSSKAGTFLNGNTSKYSNLVVGS